MSTEMWVHGPSGYCVRVERCRLGLHARLRALTNLAAFVVGFDGLLHLGPPVLSEDQLFVFLMPGCLAETWSWNWAMILPQSA